LEDLPTSEVESSRDERLGSWRCGQGVGYGQLRVHALFHLYMRYQAPRASRAAVLESQAAASIHDMGKGHKVH
jgi:hypothetical protein